jgi:hypothetical protein
MVICRIVNRGSVRRQRLEREDAISALRCPPTEAVSVRASG